MQFDEQILTNEEVKIMNNENKTNINWYKPNYGKLPMKSYK